MSETINLDITLIGRTLLAIQADLRSVRDEVALLRLDLGRMARREELLDTQRTLTDRIAAFETTVLSRMDQSERSVEERLQRLETGQAEVLLLLRRLSTGEGFAPRGAAPSPTPEQPSVIPLPAPE